LTIKPLPTNGLQVEGQGSVQEPRHSRPHDGPTRPSRGILPPRRFKNYALAMRSFSNDRVNISLLNCQSPRDTAARVGNYSDFPTRVKLSQPRPSP